MSCSVAAFYCFHPLAHFAALQEPLRAHCAMHGALGIVLLAPEGINATLACPETHMPALVAGIESLIGFSLAPKYSSAPTLPFKRLKVRLKAEIVTMGDADVDPLREVGTYVKPADWNALISDPDVLVIDTRNSFEHTFGTFAGAKDPGTEDFSDFPDYARKHLSLDKTRKIAMFCTGGIRCEKATSLLVREGFSQVYHLEGGILKYLEEVPESASLWQGDCFVFDDRVGLTHGLAMTHTKLCLACSHPVNADGQASPLFEEGVCCARCFSTQNEAQKASARERQRQMTKALR
jgi:UPF0176 protein